MGVHNIQEKITFKKKITNVKKKHIYSWLIITFKLRFWGFFPADFKYTMYFMGAVLREEI